MSKGASRFTTDELIGLTLRGSPAAAEELRKRLKLLKAVGLFWQTYDGRLHFSVGSTKRGDIHDNGRPICIAYMGEEAE